MRLRDLLGRSPEPEPWAEGDNIPWHEPGFSARMLREHLSQEHDAASRRAGQIDRHVGFIAGEVLGGRPARVLDLGCGPGLYSARLARLGCACRGIDYSPASIAYAGEHAPPGCEYVLGDVRQTEFGQGHDLVMLLYGELNVFRPEHARELLRRAGVALGPGGRLLLEPHTFAAVRDLAGAPSWSCHAEGLFSPGPHLLLTETFWHGRDQAATLRYWVVDLDTGEVSRCAQTMQAYDDTAYAALLTDAGLREVARWPSLTGGADEPGPLFALLAERA